MLKESRMKTRQNIFALCALAGLAAHASACAVSNAFVSSGPAPRVEDCALIQQATPSRWVCGGKVYTSVQLAEARTGNRDAKSATGTHAAAIR
jgi:hypothetical protein